MASRLNFLAKRCDRLMELADKFEFKDGEITFREWVKRQRLYDEALALSAVLSDVEKNVCPFLKSLRSITLPAPIAGKLDRLLEDFRWAEESLYDKEELEQRQLNNLPMPDFLNNSSNELKKE